MYWYCVKRSIAFCTILLSRLNTGPWLGSRNCESSLRIAFERRDEGGDAGAMMGVDDADAAILIDVVAAEEEIAELEAELAGGVAGSGPDAELQVADLDDVAIV